MEISARVILRCGRVYAHVIFGKPVSLQLVHACILVCDTAKFAAFRRHFRLVCATLKIFLRDSEQESRSVAEYKAPLRSFHVLLLLLLLYVHCNMCCDCYCYCDCVALPFAARSAVSQSKVRLPCFLPNVRV